jgi:tRNA1(Val) A37 N6-methylase TrmN6
MAEAVTEDGALGGRLRLKQPRRGHRFGHDAMLLAAATAAQPGEHVVELAAGVGAAGLALAQRVSGLRVTLVEIDPLLAAIAQENAEMNALAKRVAVVALDALAPAAAFAAAGLPARCAQHVIMNPPFNDPAVRQRSPDPARARAHAASAPLAAWIGCVRRLLVDGGALTLIWRADGLAEVLGALAGFGGIALKPVHPRADAPAIRILLRAHKGRRAPLQLLPGLVLHDPQGSSTAAVEAILRDGAPLPLA